MMVFGIWIAPPADILSCAPVGCLAHKSRRVSLGVFPKPPALERVSNLLPVDTSVTYDENQVFLIVLAEGV